MASVVQLGQRFAQHLERCDQHRLRIDLGLAHYARPAQQFQRADRRGVRQFRADLRDAGEQLIEQRVVQLERALRAAGGFEIQARVDLATAECCCDHLAHFVVERLELVRQPQRSFQVAVVHGPQLADQRAPRPLALAPREPCHASDHWFRLRQTLSYTGLCTVI
jgi:hypothetical protein